MNYKVKVRNENFTILEQLLYNRGITTHDAMVEFIAPTEKVIKSEYKLSNIEEAAKELCRNLAHQNKVYIQVDSDCDGYTSAAVLLNYLHRIFPATVENNFIYNVHDSKHHGINIEAIPDDVKLVIAPDSSSNENDIHKSLQEREIHTIILDHHQAKEDESDPAIIVNNQMCDYENKALSGVGIVYKFCKVLDKIFHVSYADDYLDLVSLGNCADMMDLREPETHYYIVQGAKNIQNIFYNKMVEKQAFFMQGEVNPFTISWYIAPLINAITRSGTIEEKQMIFEAFLDYKAVENVQKNNKGVQELRVDKALRVAGSVKNRQEKTKKEILDKILPTIDPESPECILVITPPEPIDENLNGLLANQLMGMFHKPTLVLGRYQEDGKTYMRGSGRGFLTPDISDWRSYIEASGYAEYAEGHAFAFGVGFEENNLKNFLAKVEEDLPHGIQTYYDVDLGYNLTDKFDKDIFQIGDMQGLWGQNAPEPLIAIENVELTQDNIRLLGKGTLRIDLKGHETNAIKFNAKDTYDRLIKLFPNSDSKIYITLIGYCAINNYQGKLSPQIKIQDYEVNKIEDWYF